VGKSGLETRRRL